MLIQPTYTDNNLLLLDLIFEPADYEPELTQKIKSAAKTAKMPGFRPGMVPTTIIRKMMGAQIIDETLRTLLNKHLTNFIKESNISYLGEPIQLNEPFKIEANLSKNYTFSFEFGLMPNIELPDYNTLSLPKYNIVVTESDVNEEIKDLQKRFSEISKPEDATVENDDTIKILFQETDTDGQLNPDGISNTMDLSVSDFKNETERQKIIGLGINQSTQINVFDAFEQDNNLIAKVILGLKDGYTNELPNTYQATITEITRYQLPELNPGFYEKIFANANIVSEQEFRTKVSEQLQQDFVQLSEGRFFKDIDKYLIENTVIQLPEIFIRKYLQATGSGKNEQLSDEEVEKRFPAYIQGTKQNLIQNKIAQAEKIEIGDDDIQDLAYAELQNQMAQYGIYQITPDWENYVKKRLEDQKYVMQLASSALQYKVSQILAEKITAIEQDITADEFAKLANQ